MLTGSFILVGTFWILPAVYFLRFMPLIVRTVQASIEQLDQAWKKRWCAGSELVAKILARAPAVGCSGRAGWSVIGICDRDGRIRRLRYRFHPEQSAGIDRYSFGVARFQSGNGGGLWSDLDRDDRDRDGRGWETGAKDSIMCWRQFDGLRVRARL